MSVIKKIVIAINRVYTKSLNLGIKIMYRLQYDKLYRKHRPNFSCKISKEDIKNYKKNWEPLCNKPDIKSFKLFSQYIGPNPRILPEDICATIINPLLNPADTKPYFQDKNMFEKILPKQFLPKTIIRMVDGVLQDSEYLHILGCDLKNFLDNNTKEVNKIFIKPALDSSSGKGVIAFKRDLAENLINPDYGVFDENFINNYSKTTKNWIVQEGLSQDSYISQFNPTSINTLRLSTYRSVKDNASHVTSAILRIGKKGTDIDNAHAGGIFIGVDENGKLARFACDQFGNKYDCFNGLSFKNTEFIIPNFKEIKDFARSVADHIPYHRLLAQDICIKEDCTPCLIEYNIRAYSMWLFQFTIGPALGNFTEEIIEYCKTRKKEINKVIVEPF